jgi:hypothetical protein
MLDKVFDFMISGQYDIAAQLLKGLNVSQQTLKKLVEKSVSHQIKNKRYDYSEFNNIYSIEIGNCLFFYEIYYNNYNWRSLTNTSIENSFLCIKFEVINQDSPDLSFIPIKEFKNYMRKLRRNKVVVKPPCNFGIYRKIIKGIASKIIKEYHIC